ncbi:MAG: hypothetical protein OEW00_08630, partial [candidate division Zixibacteria bacterium]|nr:hypothetical protein [candidate division Zixibacteria bacterium]
ILPGTSIQALEIWLKAMDEYVGFYLPLDISCSSSDVNIEAVHPRDSVYAAGALLRDAMGATFAAGVYRLAVIWVSVTASADTQYIVVDTVAPVFSRRTSRLVRASLPQFVTVPGCCMGLRGNANGDIENKINISDITYLVDYLFGIPTGFPPPCREEGNVNGDPDEKINVSDVSFIVTYLFGSPPGPSPPACPNY